MARLGSILVILCAISLGCEDRPERFEVDPIRRSPIEREAAPCFGGREVGALPIADVYYPRPGYVLGRVEVGRCDGSEAPLELTVRVEPASDAPVLGTLRLDPSDGPARREAAWLSYLALDSHVRYELRGDDPEARAFVRPLGWTVLPARPASLPAAVDHVFGSSVETHGHVLTLGTPATLRMRLRPGLHTLSGDAQHLDGPVTELVVARPERDVDALMHRPLPRGAPAPFTVTFATLEREPVELALTSDGARVELVGLRHDHGPSLGPSPRGAAPPPEAPEPRATPPRTMDALLAALTRVESAGAPHRGLCADRDAYVTAPPSRVVLAAGPARRLRGAVGPCGPTEGGEATWRVETADGEELASRVVGWEPDERPADRFEVDLPAGVEIHLVTEGSGPTAWIGLRAPIALGDARTSASAFNESEENRLYAPENVIDSDPSTEWHLPDHQLGWLEIRIAEPIDLTGVGLLDGHNPGYGDRATRELTVRAYAGEEERAAVEITFDALEEDPGWVTAGLEAEGVDRIRVEPTGYSGLGPALAELELY